MESAGKLVEDEELKAAMSERGLGTPATRAAIIEGLIMDRYVHREGRTLFATAKGIKLVDLLVERIRLDSLCSPELTGDWEYRLKEIEQGRLERESFMNDIRSMTRDIVEKIRAVMEAPPPEFPDLDAVCPACGGSPLKQTEDHYSCPAEDCRFRLRKTVASRDLTGEEVKILTASGSVGPLQGFLSRAGEEFSAALRLDEKFKATFSFDDSDQDGSDLDDPIAPCPICREAGRSGQLHAASNAYVCEQHYTEAKCPAKLPRRMLKAEITREQALKFFNDGRTDVISNFVSRKSGRRFSASLVLKAGGGDRIFDFDFPPRPPRRRKDAGGKGAA
jgi:DNA topoisomerase-3